MFKTCRLGVSVLVGAIAAGGMRAMADPIPKGSLRIELVEVASGLTAPISVKHAGDGSGRLFIVEQSGQIKIVENGVLLATPFLDISDRIVEQNAFFDERGLLGVAFHPEYESNGRFFVRYSAPREGEPDEPCADPANFIAGCHTEILAEYHVTADPNVADHDSEIILFAVDEPQFNHNSGEVDFGPDGFLYWTLGDGGGANDGLADDPPSHGPIGNGQNIETALGSILRIDVDSPPQAPLPYAIPPDNPFVGVTGVDEIYAYGLRNPFKFSFDDGPGGDGSLFLADVGQNLFEEVNIIELGGNYGWVIKEGTHCFDPFNPIDPPAMCPDTGPMGEPLIDPIVDYSHPGSGFDPEGGITVIGGYVYRGAVSPELFGTYLFGDFAQAFVLPTGSLYHLIEPASGVFEIRQFIIGLDDRDYGLFLKGFGEDEAGEVYACGSTALAPFGTTGVVHQIVSIPNAGLDIRPGDCPNPFNRNSNGLLPVALVGSDTFDVSQVDLSTVRLKQPDAEEVFAANLSGDQENPPVMTAASGTGAFTLSADGSMLTYDIQVQGVDFDGMQTPDMADNVVAMHIHNAPVGVNGGVIFGMISPAHDADIMIDPVAGTVSGTWDAGDPSNAPLSAMIDELRNGLMYVNVHTVAHPSGEIRGQILLTSGSVGPHEGPPGPGSTIEDVATPFSGEPCDCHSLGGDGTDDLSLKFKTEDVVEALGLGGLENGALVPLIVTGKLLDGRTFTSDTDCIRLVPPGTPPGLLAVQSNVAGTWIAVSPPDLLLDSGGFANFERTFPESTVATVSAALSAGGKTLLGWKVNGAFEPISKPTLLTPSAFASKKLVVDGMTTTIEAVYGPATKTKSPTSDGNNGSPKIQGFEGGSSSVSTK